MTVVVKQVEEYHAKVISAFKSRYESLEGQHLNVFDFYPDYRRLPDGPVNIFVTVVDFVPHTEQYGNGMLVLSMSWETRIVVRYKDPKDKVLAIGMASDIANFVHQSPFEVDNAHPPESISSTDENFDKINPGVEVWAVTWQQPVIIGEDFWENQPLTTPKRDSHAVRF